jgi:H+-translocating NAD(P) transhydrogenase subunit alpha
MTSAPAGRARKPPLSPLPRPLPCPGGQADRRIAAPSLAGVRSPRSSALAGSIGAASNRAGCRLAVALVLLPTPALAAAGGDISPVIYQFMVFVIAIFVGYYVVWSVTPALHTPLMSVTNAISSVIVVGALLAVGVALIAAGSGLAKAFGFLALTMASVNIFGGFLVTQRMLGMYKKREPKR